jgi:urease subunit alpha
MFGAIGGALAQTCFTFLPRIAIDEGLPARLGLKRQCTTVRGVRRLTKKDMVLNDYLPFMEVDPQTYAVRADGQLLYCEPLAELPLAQRYFLF